MTSVLVTGGTGQVATELAARLGPRAILAGRPAFDFEQPGTVADAFAAARPSLVVNAAAWTAVDAAEANADAAYRANRDGPALLGALCKEAGIPLIHISTDYVFDGHKPAPYLETDPTGPTGVYGASKLAGEHAVLATGCHAVILRTAWVYNATGKNFVRTMLNLGQKMPALRVVADQMGNPTHAGDLADAILGVMDRLAQGWDASYGGIFHACGTGSTTWHGFAEAIFEYAAQHGRSRPLVNAIATAEYPTPAKRPANSRLDCEKLRAVFGVELPVWRPSLARTVAAIVAG